MAPSARFLKWVLAHHLVHSFCLTSLDDPPSTVAKALKGTGTGTEFGLITESIVAGSKSEESMADGTRFTTRNLKAFMETGKVTFGARAVLAIVAPTKP